MENKKIYPRFDRHEFKLLIDEINYFQIFHCKDEHNNKILTIIYAIINKYNNEDTWFFEKYLEIFFLNHIYVYHENCKNFTELIKVKHILQKYKLSYVIELFYDKIKLRSVKVDGNLEEWLNNRVNCYIFYTYLRTMCFLIPYLIKDIKIPNKFELCETEISQLVYVIRNYDYCVEELYI